MLNINDGQWAAVCEFLCDVEGGSPSVTGFDLLCCGGLSSQLCSYLQPSNSCLPESSFESINDPRVSWQETVGVDCPSVSVSTDGSTSELKNNVLVIVTMWVPQLYVGNLYT